MLLLLHALGGSEIPDVLLRSVRCPQRRWNANGEIEGISATEFGLPFGLINALSDDIEYAQIVASSYITKHLHDDGTVSWSVCPEMRSFFNQALLPQTLSELGTTALKFLCFACPPCYEGNTTWYAPESSPAESYLMRNSQVSSFEEEDLAHIREYIEGQQT